MKQSYEEYKRKAKIRRDSLRHLPEYKRKQVEIASRHHRKLRQLVIEHYGGSPPVCACCGEDTYCFLSLDHINNDGAEKRRLHGGQKEEWRYIVKNGYPEGYQVLCYNCNIAKKNCGGVCPHTINHG